MNDQPTQVDKWAAQYVALRDVLKKFDEANEVKRKEFKGLMEELSGKMQHFLETSGVDSASTKGGTIYTSIRYTASLADPEAFMRFVIETRQFDLLDRKANSTAVKDYVGEHNVLPTGCNLTAMKTLGVRRSTK
jgi:cell division GTPase FtsZ